MLPPHFVDLPGLNPGFPVVTRLFVNWRERQGQNGYSVLFVGD